MYPICIRLLQKVTKWLSIRNPDSFVIVIDPPLVQSRVQAWQFHALVGRLIPTIGQQIRQVGPVIRRNIRGEFTKPVQQIAAGMSGCELLREGGRRIR